MRKRRRLNPVLKRKLKEFGLMSLVVASTLSASGFLALDMAIEGPSPIFSQLLVSTLQETRRGKYVLQFFYNEQELEEISNQNSIKENDSVTITNDQGFIIPEDEKDDIEVIDIHGATYTGKLMIVRDPSRISLAYIGDIDSSMTRGIFLEEYVSHFNAIGGINAGGFMDPNWQSNGTQPMGLVIRDGEIVYGDPTYYDSLIGFNDNNKLYVGKMTGEQAIEWGMKEAVTFGPALIVNGQPMDVSGSGGGLNPRTAIGQTWDGSVLLLTIDGRQTNSLGASYSDLIQIFLEYGASDAANLDGGSSSVMVYEGSIINSPVSMNGDRAIPTAWIVK